MANGGSSNIISIKSSGNVVATYVFQLLAPGITKIMEQNASTCLKSSNFLNVQEAEYIGKCEIFLVTD